MNKSNENRHLAGNSIMESHSFSIDPRETEASEKHTASRGVWEQPLECHLLSDEYIGEKNLPILFTDNFHKTHNDSFISHHENVKFTFAHCRSNK